MRPRTLLALLLVVPPVDAVPDRRRDAAGMGDHGRARRVDGRPRDASPPRRGARRSHGSSESWLAASPRPMNCSTAASLSPPARSCSRRDSSPTRSGSCSRSSLAGPDPHGSQEVRRDPVPRQRDQRVHHRKRVYRRIPRNGDGDGNGAGAGFTMGGGFGGGNFGNGDGFGSDDEVAGGNSPVTIPTATASTTRTTRTMSSTWTSRSKTRRRTGATEAPPSTRSPHRESLPTRSVTDSICF